MRSRFAFALLLALSSWSSSAWCAQVRIDGTLFTRSSNTITDVIPNVTLNLATGEPGTTVDLAVTRDTTSAVNAAKALATAYNAAADFVKTNSATGGSSGR